MSDLRDELEKDIVGFFKHIEDQEHNDKLVTLRLLMDKYIHLSKSTFLMGKIELNEITSRAKDIFAKKTMPMHIGPGRSLVGRDDQPTMCIVEATIEVLNNRECLKKLPKFDYKE